jgi:ubiquinone/menaquinone biosynthesis C-methylase UbiE
MNLDELLPLLRCLRCGGPVGRQAVGLACRECGRSYPVVDDIPVMLENGAEEEVWERYFHKLAETRGDAEAANSYFNLRSFRIVRDNLLRLIGEIRNLTILDVGCGTGHFSQSLVKDNRLVGVDVSFDMAVYARRKGLHTVQSSGKKLPFTGDSFALVIANNVIQSFRDGSPLIAELARVTEPGGRVILSATNGDNLAMAFFRLAERRKYKHLGVYSADRLRRLLCAAGLTVESMLFFYFPAGRVARIPGGARVRFLSRRLSATVAVEAVKPR